MPTLKETQTQFLHTVFNRENSIQAQISSANSEIRLQIYRNTIFNGLCHALSVIYPGVWKLLGGECADNAALMFCHNLNNLPTDGCLDRWGKKFAKFLGSVHAFAALPYLEDYAWYEFLWHQAYCGYGKSVYYFKSKFPINEIQELLDNPNSSTLDLTEKPSYAIIMRPEQKVLTLWITQEKWHALNIKEAEYA